MTDLAKQDSRRHKRLGLILQHLAAHGRTNRFKVCQGKTNRGWLRTALGGGSTGMQYYVWWTRAGSPPAKGLALDGPNHILIRTIRHHDEHSPLDIANLHKNYFPLVQPDLDDVDEEFAGCPWTPSQLRFIDDSSPVRLLFGVPGSGKTTALWKAVEVCSDQKVLYLTWSSRLRVFAQERFQSFAPTNVQVQVLDFATFLSELCHRDIPRLSLSASCAAFRELMPLWRFRDQMKPWVGWENALHAEMRTILLGGTVLDEDDYVRLHQLGHLPSDTYRHWRSCAVGRSAVDAILRTMDILPPGDCYNGGGIWSR